MAIRNWIGTLKSLQCGRSQWDSIRAVSTMLQPKPSAALSPSPSSSEGAMTHAHASKVKFLGVFVGFVDDSKWRRQYDKALEKRRRVIHRLRQLQKQRQESWAKQVEQLAYNAFTRAYRKTLNTLRSGSKAKQAIFDKATELGTKSALTLTDKQPLMTSDDLKTLLEQEEDHFGRLGWDYLPVTVKTAYENLILSIEEACEDAAKKDSRPPAVKPPLRTAKNVISEQPEVELPTDLSTSCEDVMERLADAETLSEAYDRIRSKLQVLSGKSDEDWNDLNMSFFDRTAHALRSGTYQFSPVSQIHVRKPGKHDGARTVLVVSPRDQIVAEAVRAELDRMYAPVFYKMATSSHMALKVIKSTWKGTTWFLHYKAPISFGKVQHANLLRILSVRIKDDEFLYLLQRMFKTNVVSMGDHGSRLSALLCNIYYHELDMEVTRIQNELNTGSNKRNEAVAEPFARVRYVRYSEEFLFGITGSRTMAVEVLERVQTFLERHLKQLA